MRDRLDLTEPDGLSGLLVDALPGVYGTVNSYLLVLYPESLNKKLGIFTINIYGRGRANYNLTLFDYPPGNIFGAVCSYKPLSPYFI